MKTNPDEAITADIVVLQASTSERIFLGMLASAFSFFGAFMLFVLLILLNFPLLNLYTLIVTLIFFPALFFTVAFLRNKILKKLFEKLDHWTYLRLVEIWSSYVFVLSIPVFVLFAVGEYFNDASLSFSAVSLFLLGMPFFFIFNNAITRRGEILILFERLLANLDDCVRRQKPLKRIAEKIEEILKAGNIQASRNELIYHFNKKLWETNDDITENLRAIERWLLDRRRTCCEAFEGIVPENFFGQVQKTTFFRNISENPTVQASLIKFVGLLIASTIIGVTVIIFRPEMANDFFNWVKSYLGF